ncbi:MAG: DNA polymerase III subunit delta [Defluviitaleaceae bacterium]|nr:DNA polymerase III subunit delta [Defluviitaleaceae bacterium]
MEEIKQELKRGNIRNLYLLHGEERFLVNHYAKAIEDLAGEEKTVFDGNIPPEEIIMAAETVPFFSQFTGKRLLLVRDSKLFAAGRKDDSEKIADYLEKIPPDTVLLFIETEIDRRIRSYKKAAELGAAIDCAPLSPPNLTKWLTRLFKNKTINGATINHIIRTCGNNMTTLNNEATKLQHYCANKPDITITDVNAICTPTLESKIFDLTKAMGAGRTGDALKMYNDMLTLKESPIMILTMIIRQLRIILLCKCHAEKHTPNIQIARELNIRDFVVSEALLHGKRFTKQSLIAALESCQSTDIKIKTGLISPELGVEILLVSLS